MTHPTQGAGEVEPMPGSSGPGWSVEVPNADGGLITYRLWAPRTAEEATARGNLTARPRDRWAANWETRDGRDGAFAYGGSAVEAVHACFPASEPGRAAAAALIAAGEASIRETEEKERYE